MWQKRFSQSGDESQPKTIHLHLSLGCLKSWKDWAEGWLEKAKDRRNEGGKRCIRIKAQGGAAVNSFRCLATGGVKHDKTSKDLYPSGWPRLVPGRLRGVE